MFAGRTRGQATLDFCVGDGPCPCYAPENNHSLVKTLLVLQTKKVIEITSLNSSLLIFLPSLSHIICQWVVRVRRSKESLNTQKYSTDLKCRGPVSYCKTRNQFPA